MKSVPLRGAVLGLMLLVGCSGGSTDGEISSALPESADSVDERDLVDGAFERVSPNDAATSPPTPEPNAAPETNAPTNAPATSVPSSDDSIPASPTTTIAADGAPAAGSSDPTTTVDPGTPLVPGSETTTTVAPSSLGGGVVTIGSVSYPFEAEVCTVVAGSFTASGFGTSSDGADVEVSLILELLDIDGDGDDDFSFDVAIEPDVALDVDLDTLPDFYAIKVESSDFNQGADISVTLDGSHLFGSGPIEDFNGIAIPEDESRQMAFDASCN